MTTRAQFEQFETFMNGFDSTIEVSIEIDVEGEWEEVTDLPKRTFWDDYAEEYRSEIDWEALEAFPEIVLTVEDSFSACAAEAYSDHCTRRAESGFAQ